jgi:hypothetical protein
MQACDGELELPLSPGKTQQFILLFLTTYFGLEGHHQVEHKIRRLYTHSLYGIEIFKPHSLYCYVGIYNIGSIAF